jgi:hypothetical protein
MITFRPAWPDELQRASSICRDVLPQGQCFVAVRDVSFERLIAVAFWRVRPKPQMDPRSAPELVAEFTWQSIPGEPEVDRALISSLAEHLGETTALTELCTYHCFTPHAPARVSLQALGFEPRETNHCYQAVFASVTKRFDQLRPAFLNLDSSRFDVDFPSAERAVEIARLIDRHRTEVSGADVMQTLSHPRGPGPAFDAEWSSVLIHRPTNRVLGVHLVAVTNELMTIRGMAIERDDVLPPGLAWFLLLGRGLDLCRQRDWCGRSQFRVNKKTAPVMHQLAHRIGYEKIEVMHSYGLSLQNGSRLDIDVSC